MGIVERLLDRHAQYGPRSLEVRAADLIERLRGYALHDPACLNVQPEYTADYTIHFPHPCTCGLTALIKEIEGD